MFDHFSKNLNASEHLIVIGYGFGDMKINDFIERNFRFGKNKMFIVDVKKPNFHLLDSDSVFFIDGGIVGMDINKILARIS